MDTKKVPKKRKDVKWLKVGCQIRILLGLRKGETDTIKEVLMTTNGAPVYFLNGDTERLAYQSFSVVLEASAREAEQLAHEAHYTEYNNTDGNGTTSK